MRQNESTGAALGGISGGARYLEAELPDFLMTLEAACKAKEKLEPPVGFELTTYALRSCWRFLTKFHRYVLRC